MIAFFDLDDTLLDGANGNMIAKYMYEEKLLGWDALFRALRYTILYKLNILPYEKVYIWSFRLSATYPIEELLIILDRAYERYILKRFFEEGHLKIEEHRKKGHFTVIATAAGEYIAEKVRVQLGADEKIAAMVPVRNGYLTDEMERPLPFGEGKLKLAKRMAEQRGHDLKDCYFYSDSAADYPLLAAVGHPVLVNPQIRLRRMVKGKGWPVERWRKYSEFPEPSKAERLSFPIS